MVATAMPQAETDESAPYQFDGIYRPVMAAAYLCAALPEKFPHFQPPTRQRIEYWAGKGLIVPDGDTWHPGRLLLNFPDLVSCQAIALMREAGLSMHTIRKAEQNLSEGGRRTQPFAYRDVWYGGHLIVDRVDPEHVFSALRPGQRGWAFVLEGMASLREKLGFADATGKAIWWEPEPGIRFDPEIQFGKPCIAGTRIPISAIWGFRVAGETAKSIAADYEVEVTDIERAYDWECSVRAILEATTRVSTRRKSEPAGV